MLADYLAINPSATFLAEQAQAQDKMRDKASYKVNHMTHQMHMNIS